MEPVYLTRPFRLTRLALAASTALILTACGGSDSDDPVITADNGTPPGTLNRIATLPLGSEATGLFVKEDGELFLNVQHPSGGNTTLDARGNVYKFGTVGVIQGMDVTGHF
ncbi:MAG: hypothetical protein ACPG75_04645, partial [Alloalcanivorax venustensis]